MTFMTLWPLWPFKKKKNKVGYYVLFIYSRLPKKLFFVLWLSLNYIVISAFLWNSLELKFSKFWKSNDNNYVLISYITQKCCARQCGFCVHPIALQEFMQIFLLMWMQSKTISITTRSSVFNICAVENVYAKMVVLYKHTHTHFTTQIQTHIYHHNTECILYVCVSVCNVTVYCTNILHR